MCVVGK